MHTQNFLHRIIISLNLSSKKVTTVYYCVLATSTVFVILLMNIYLETELIPTKQTIIINFTRTSEVSLEKIFDLMADIEMYPEIIPNNYISVRIINRTDSFVQAEEQIVERSIRTTLTVNHTIIPYKQHSIYIIDGLVKGSQLNLHYQRVENSTQITVIGEIHLSGILSAATFIAENTIENKIEQTLVQFEKYLDVE